MDIVLCASNAYAKDNTKEEDKLITIEQVRRSWSYHYQGEQLKLADLLSVLKTNEQTSLMIDPVYSRYRTALIPNYVGAGLMIVGGTVSSKMFGETFVPFKQATIEENLLYIYDFDNDFGDGVYAWFKYDDNLWYKMDWDNSKYVFKGFNTNGVPDVFRTIFCLNKIKPHSLKGKDTKYENNNVF